MEEFSSFLTFSSKGGSSPGVRGAGHATSGSRHHRVIEGTRRTINNSKRRIFSLDDDDSINMINHIYHQDVSTKLRFLGCIIMETILYCFWWAHILSRFALQIWKIVPQLAFCFLRVRNSEAFQTPFLNAPTKHVYLYQTSHIFSHKQPSVHQTSFKKRRG